APSLKKSNEATSSSPPTSFRVQQTLGVWGAGAAAQAQPAHSVLHAVLPVRPAHSRLVLQHKQLPHQIVNLNLVRKPDWFLAKSSSGKITCDYLEDATPEPPLYPGDARKRAATCAWLLARWATPSFPPSIDGPCGEEDEQKSGCRSPQRCWASSCPRTGFDKLLGWTSRMEQQRAVKETRISDGVHAAFFKAYWAKEVKSPSASKPARAASRGKNVLMETAKHLESGEPEPQLKPNLLTLYSMRFCPFPSAPAWPCLQQQAAGATRLRHFEQLVTELESMQSTLGDSKFFAGSETVPDGRPHDLAMFERLKPSWLAGWLPGARGAAEIADVLDGQDGAAAGGSRDGATRMRLMWSSPRSLLANQPK
uniref:GST N-terminal domain-containing protein n=1 Tax=Macrostomum lignano TaxID=282301 RepID=A0A1I8IXD3_9PLAT